MIPDAVPTYGYPDIVREQKDKVLEGMIIFPDNQAVIMPGKLSSWKFFSVRNATMLALQIWRQVFDLKVS